MNSRDTTVDLVITPPKEMGGELAQRFSARMTLGTLTTLVAQAQNRIILATPFFQAHSSEFIDPLRDALKHALKRGVELDFIGTGYGLDEFREELAFLIGQGKIRFFRPKPNIENEQYLGSHAKILVVDAEQAYIGSANFTQPGLGNNLEIGTLVSGNVASQIDQFIDYLIEIDFLVEISV